MVAALNAESALNPYAEGDNGQAYGIGQWHPDRQAAFAKWAGHDMRQSSGDLATDRAEQLRFIDYELGHGERAAGTALRTANTEAQAREVMVRMYERPKDPESEIARAAPNINTDITVNAANADASEVVRLIAAHQARISAAATREFLAGGQ